VCRDIAFVDFFVATRAKFMLRHKLYVFDCV
jgi:hypothetical protein